MCSLPRTAPRRLRRLQHIDESDLLADFLEIAERLFLDRRQAVRDIALGRLTVGKVGSLVCISR